MRTNHGNRGATRFLLPACLAFAGVLWLGPGSLAQEEAPPPPTTSAIAVNVGTFHNQKGTLGCRLYSSAAGFPESTSGTIETRVRITGANVRCDFEDVPPGTYAISVMHDEDDDQKLKKNFLGIPTEGFGAPTAPGRSSWRAPLPWTSSPAPSAMGG